MKQKISVPELTTGEYCYLKVITEQNNMAWGFPVYPK